MWNYKIMCKIEASRDERCMTPPERREASGDINLSLENLKEKITKWISVFGGGFWNSGQRSKIYKSARVWKSSTHSGVYKYSTRKKLRRVLFRRDRVGRERKDVWAWREQEEPNHESPWLPSSKSHRAPLSIFCRGVTWLELHFRDNSRNTVEGVQEAGPDQSQKAGCNNSGEMLRAWTKASAVGDKGGSGWRVGVGSEPK